MDRFLSRRPAPSDASAISALLARDELERVEAERRRLLSVIAGVAPQRSRILETRLKQLTRRVVELGVVVRRGRP